MAARKKYQTKQGSVVQLEKERSALSQPPRKRTAPRGPPLSPGIVGALSMSGSECLYVCRQTERIAQKLNEPLARQFPLTAATVESPPFDQQLQQVRTGSDAGVAIAWKRECVGM